MVDFLKDNGYECIEELTSHEYETQGEYVEHQMVFRTDDDTDTMVNFKTKLIEGRTKVSNIRIF